MMRRSISLAVLATSIFYNISTAHYTLTNDLSGENFFQSFDLFSDHDPTNGFVAYQPLASAIKNKYIGYIPNRNTSNVFLGVDYTNVTPAGRPSIRAESKMKWNHGLLLADIRHMPASTCGSWPAFWMLGEGLWPTTGEIDILEGVNDQVSNLITLHTTTGCIVDNTTRGNMGMADQGLFSGEMLTDNCDVKAADQDKNQGCSIHALERASGEKLHTYGTDFNSVGGGMYAMEWTATSISVWFFARNSDAFSDHFSNTTSATEFQTSAWGKPLARFAGTGCDFEQRFKNLRIIFNTAFCGEWAGRQEVWDSSCAAKTGVATCADYVRDNPSAFQKAYWEIEALRWYENKDRVEKRSVGGVHQKGREYRW
jgi:hypothetical protein